MIKGILDQNMKRNQSSLENYIFSAYFLVIMAFLLLFFSGTTKGATLWRDNSTNPFADSRGIGLGSVVTILIDESAKATQQATTSTNAAENNSVAAGTGFLQFMPMGGSNASANYTGSGTTSRSGSLSASITAMVTEELPNGLLRVEGSRKVKINDELQEIVVKGLVRPEDISKNNTVASIHLAGAEIQYKGLGVVGRTQRSGILHRVIHWIF